VSGVVRGLRGLRRTFGVRAGSVVLAPLHRRLGNTLRVLASGGSKLDPSVGTTLEALGWQVAIGYGLTETSPILTIAPPGRADLESVGQAIEGIELRVDRDAPAAEGEDVGELLARGPSVFDGYHRRDRDTRESFTRDGFFRTGDLGRIDDEGRVHLSGRVSTMIVTRGGENVPPQRLESTYAAHDAIDEVGVLVAEGDELAALVVPSAEAARSAENLRETIDDALRERSRELPSHHRVSSFRITREALPRTRLGKLRRHRLEERFRQASGEAERRSTARREPMPKDEMSAEDRGLLEQPAAREAWQVLTRRFPEAGLTPDTDLRLDLGVDSLGWVDLSMQLHERTGVELDEERIASVESVRDLLRAVVDAPESEAGERVDPLEEPEQTLSEDQRARLTPPSGVARRIADALYATNRKVFERLFDLRVEGAERIPREGPFLLTPNHSSYLDPFAVAAALPASVLRRTLWAGWTGAAFRNRIFRGASRLARALPVDPEEAARSSLAFAGAVLDRREGLVWFPEGGRSRDGTLQPFREGVGRLASERPEVPVVPAHVEGTHDAWPVDRRWPRRGRVRVRFGDPVPGRALVGEHGDAQSAAETLRDRVASLAPANRDRDDGPTRSAPMAGEPRR
jgi:long-chain acyl-CoA synthetase